jgi:hypothetical protein
MKPNPLVSLSIRLNRSHPVTGRPPTWARQLPATRRRPERHRPRARYCAQPSAAHVRARLLLPTLRPVWFSPPRCAILFPSPSHLGIARPSPTAPLLLVRDIKDRRASHRSSCPRVSGHTSLSSALASSYRPPSRPRKKSPKQS